MTIINSYFFYGKDNVSQTAQLSSLGENKENKVETRERDNTKKQKRGEDKVAHKREPNGLRFYRQDERKDRRRLQLQSFLTSTHSLARRSE